MLHVVARVGICLPEIVRHLSVTPRAPWLHLPSAADAIRAKFGLNEFPWVIFCSSYHVLDADRRESCIRERIIRIVNRRRTCLN